VKKAAAEAARKVANNARKAAAAAEALKLANNARRAAAGASRGMGLVQQAGTKKTLDQFFKNFQITGASPTTILAKTTQKPAISNAWRFLNKSMLIPIRGSKYPNKLNWPGAVASLDQYDLTNAQKNLIRRVNIAVAAQPIKGGSEIRRPVKVTLSGNRNKNIAAQRAAMKKENYEKRQMEQARANAERRGARASRPRSSAPPRNNVGKWLASGGL
jgi:hypothetical protein